MNSENNTTVKNRQLLSGTAIYAVGNFGTKILNFLIVPLYTYYIDPGAMGDYDLLMTVVSLLIPLLTLQIGDAAYRELIAVKSGAGSQTVDHEATPANSSQNAGHEVTPAGAEKTAAVNFCYKVLLADLLLILISSGVFYAFSHYRYTGYFILIMTGSAAYNTIQKLLRGLHRQKLFAASGILYTLLFAGLNVLQICVLGQGITGMFISAATAYWVSTVFILIAEKGTRPSHRTSGKRAAGLLSEFESGMLKYAVPLIPNQLNWWIMNSSDRFIIRLFLGSEANGIYAIAYKFPTMLQSIFSLFTNSFTDVSVGDTDETDGEYYSGVFDKYSVFVMSAVILAIPASKVFIDLFMDTDYRTAAGYVGFLYLGCVFQSFSAYYGVGYLRQKKTGGASATSIFGAVVNIVVDVILIKTIGLFAAALSTAAGFCLMWICRVVQVGKVMQIKIKMKHFIPLVAAVTAMAVVSCFTDMRTDICLTVVAAGVFLFANKNFYLRFIHRSQKTG